MGDGSARSGRLACTEDSRRVRIPYSPPGNVVQLVEHAPDKCVVASSSLAISTNKTWGMGLPGVDASLAPRIAEGFESLILHQEV